jgi:hypothetical protein
MFISTSLLTLFSLFTLFTFFDNLSFAGFNYRIFKSYKNNHSSVKNCQKFYLEVLTI